MKGRLYLPISVEEASRGFNEMLARYGFIFSEEDKAYLVEYDDTKAEKKLIWSRFWSRKTLSGECPPNYFMVVEGEIKQEGNGSVIELEFVEYHTNRPHRLGGEGGAMFISKYFDRLIRDARALIV